MSRFILVTVALVVAVLLGSFTVDASLTGLRNYLSAREHVLDQMVKSVEEQLKTRCSTLSSYTKTSSMCENAGTGSVFSNATHKFRCTTKFGSDTRTCSSRAGCGGLIRSVNKSTVLFAPKTSWYTTSAAKETQAFVAMGNTFDRTAESLTNYFKAWITFGEQGSGAARQFPGAPHHGKYDPRLRSWYQAAASGPKDVVLVLDVSGSMGWSSGGYGSPSRLSLMQEACRAIIGALTNVDYFQIVTFGSYGYIKMGGGSKNLQQGTEANKQAALNIINGLSAGGGTYFNTGFQRMNEIFTQSTTTSGCQRIVLFLTDGVASDSGHLSTLSGYQSGYGSRKAAIFTYTMSSGASTTIPRAIACANQGVHAHFADGVNPTNTMAGYFKIIASGVNSTQPVYVEPYTDAFGLGKMTTLSRAVRIHEGNKSIFYGAIGIDVPMSELTSFLLEGAVVSELISRSNVCPNTTNALSHCSLQLLRNEAGYECPSGQTLAQCRTAGVVSEASQCTLAKSSVNSLLCGTINPTTMVAETNPKRYGDLVCCKDGAGATCANSAGFIASSIALIAAILVAVIGMIL